MQHYGHTTNPTEVVCQAMSTAEAAANAMDICEDPCSSIEDRIEAVLIYSQNIRWLQDHGFIPPEQHICPAQNTDGYDTQLANDDSVSRRVLGERNGTIAAQQSNSSASQSHMPTDGQAHSADQQRYTRTDKQCHGDDNTNRSLDDQDKSPPWYPVIHTNFDYLETPQSKHAPLFSANGTSCRHWDPQTHWGLCGEDCPCCRVRMGYQNTCCPICLADAHTKHRRRRSADTQFNNSKTKSTTTTTTTHHYTALKPHATHHSAIQLRKIRALTGGSSFMQKYTDEGRTTHQDDEEHNSPQDSQAQGNGQHERPTATNTASNDAEATQPRKKKRPRSDSQSGDQGQSPQQPPLGTTPAQSSCAGPSQPHR